MCACICVCLHMCVPEYVYMCICVCLHMCMCAYVCACICVCEHSAHKSRGIGRHHIPLALELKAIVSCLPMVLGIQLRPSGRVVHALNH